MQIGPTFVVDTFAEAFRMRYARLIVSAINDYWLDAATRELCGYGSSVIQCDAEIAVERRLAADESPDGRPAAAVLAFGFSTDALAKALPKRVGQCVMTCATSAVYDGLPPDDSVEQDRIPLGSHIRFFGDGFQKSKKPADRRFWRIPVMDGEFLVEDSLGVQKGVAGGNLIVQGTSQRAALDSARRAVEAVASLAEVITPFPGGVVRSGSKVGSRYDGLVASTNDAFCPTLRGRVATQLVPEAQCAYEVVINGTSESAVADAMRLALHAAAGPEIPALSAGNYGGKLGKFHYHLRKILAPG
ncbi:formylmethanofuran--tetrahydromethanopterin N-formyltransferase [Aeoliella mucimassa]|uniref:Formyltransferase/hydrolase complex subunit D n=1 Tax=Aeoliella mucimassa TaxID=2527972 RepID=A0A518AHK5_9BACT|nr:formylmethanofuran--tetrahydromethanopterin N-formyltransferase [Aeoliella mucimassa]QDU54207.1 Formyltransferase/hydrolase complex subunit D [Aeoliella mucimassa]